MKTYSLPDKQPASKELLVNAIVAHYLMNPSSMCFDVVGDVLEGNVLMEIQGINDFTVALVGSKPSWLVCTKSKESIVSPATYLGLPIYIERSDRVDQVSEIKDQNGSFKPLRAQLFPEPAIQTWSGTPLEARMPLESTIPFAPMTAR